MRLCTGYLTPFLEDLSSYSTHSCRKLRRIRQNQKEAYVTDTMLIVAVTKAVTLKANSSCCSSLSVLPNSASCIAITRDL